MDQTGSFPTRHHAHTCSVTDSNSTADNQTGPGRLVDNAFVYLGRHLEVTLGKVAVKMGRGPLVTAERILRQRAEILAITSWHDKYCYCLDCELRIRFGFRSFRGEAVRRSPAKLKKLSRGVNIDCRRLVNYVRSEQCSTQQQAVDSVLDLSVHDGELRAMLKAHRASEAISDLVDIYQRFRFSGPDIKEALLTSSRKALVSLDDENLNAQLKEWVSAVRHSGDFLSTLEVHSEVHAAWERISGYLWDRDRAFLVMRAVRSCVYSIAVHFLCKSVLGAVVKSPSYFEWEECDEVVFNYLLMPRNQKRWTVDISDWLFRNLHRMPLILVVWPFGTVREEASPMDSDFWESCTLEESIIKNIKESGCTVPTMEVLQDRYPDRFLKPLLRTLSCPVRTVVRSCIERPDFPYTPGQDERRMYGELVSFIESCDSVLQAKAWKYIDHFLARDIYRCNMMLDAMSYTAFGHSDNFSEFKERTRANLIPIQGESYNSVLRHYDSGGNTYYCSHYWCSFADSVNTGKLEYPRHWNIFSKVERGKSFSSDGLFLLPAGKDRHGNETYLALIYYRYFHCMGWTSRGIYSAIKEGTKPEDLRVEVQCRRTKVLRIPKEFSVYVLRYAPEAYAQLLGTDAENLFTTGPFAWKPSRHDCELNPTFRRRVITIEEAFAMGYSEAEIYPKVESNRNCGCTIDHDDGGWHELDKPSHGGRNRVFDGDGTEWEEIYSPNDSSCEGPEQSYMDLGSLGKVYADDVGDDFGPPRLSSVVQRSARVDEVIYQSFISALMEESTSDEEDEEITGEPVVQLGAEVDDEDLNSMYLGDEASVLEEEESGEPRPIPSHPHASDHLGRLSDTPIIESAEDPCESSSQPVDVQLTAFNAMDKEDRSLAPWYPKITILIASICGMILGVLLDRCLL